MSKRWTIAEVLHPVDNIETGDVGLELVINIAIDHDRCSCRHSCAAGRIDRPKKSAQTRLLAKPRRANFGFTCGR